VIGAAVNLAVELGPLRLKNPVITASGTFGYGEEFEDFLDLSALGGITVKGLTLSPRRGNPAPRMVETASGMLNAVGLANIGYREFIEDRLPRLRRLDTAIIANIAGETVGEFAELARAVGGAEGVSALEVNVSCPNLGDGGVTFGSRPDSVHEITRAVRGGAPDRPIFVKLSPNVTDIVEIARAAVDGGADGLSVANTYLGLAIDSERRRPRLGGVTGGLSGPAIKPLTLRLVRDVHRALPAVPIVGIGGIMTGTDAVEYLLAGASAVAVGTASLVNPTAAADVLAGVERHCRRHGVEDIRELIGALET
jgi:dihydroorotate dehydrogenase (NAD+) catalytic subunit